jgi:uncharacterized membrane protein YeaQ/YmgE (transglycosylase-associated protein family)
MAYLKDLADHDGGRRLIEGGVGAVSGDQINAAVPQHREPNLLHHEIAGEAVGCLDNDCAHAVASDLHDVGAGEPTQSVIIVPIDRSIGRRVMHLSNQSLLVIILVGIIAGWLAGRVMEGGGFGLIGDLLVGLIGAFVGDWMLPRLGIHLGTGLVAAIMNAFIGAVVFLLILRLLSGGFGYRRRWRSW